MEKERGQEGDWEKKKEEEEKEERENDNFNGDLGATLLYIEFCMTL